MAKLELNWSFPKETAVLRLICADFFLQFTYYLRDSLCEKVIYLPSVTPFYPVKEIIELNKIQNILLLPVF